MILVKRNSAEQRSKVQKRHLFSSLLTLHLLVPFNSLMLLFSVISHNSQTTAREHNLEGWYAIAKKDVVGWLQMREVSDSL